MGFLKNFLQKTREKFKRDGSFREAFTTWRVSNTYSKKNLKKFESLLKKGKKYYNLIKFRENYSYSLLHQAIHDRDREAIDIIVSQSYVNEIIDDSNNDLSISPLQMSCVIDDLDLFQLIEQKGANIHLTIPQQNLHLLHISSHNGSLRILDYIFKKYFGKNIDVLSAENWTPLHYACYQNKMDIASYIIDCYPNLYVRNKQQMTPLDLAILQDNFELFKALYEFHYDKSKFSNMEFTKPVHIAATSKIGTRCLDYLIKDSNNLNEICDTNIRATPLHFACLSNNLPAVKVLCMNSAMVNSADYIGNTPLFYAVENDNLEIIKVLDEYGGDANIKNIEGLDPYSIAFYNDKNNAKKFFLGNINYRMRNYHNNISI